jgi:Domain of unknown function (DUF305)
MESSMPTTLAACLRVACAIGLGLAAISLAAAEDPGPSRLPDDTVEASFLRDNDAAMTRMMNDMAVHPTGDVDRDFALSMIPHHQGAIDMAIAELRYGRNEQLRRIAQEIVIDQMQEIAAMRLAIGEPPPASSAAPTQPSGAPAHPDHHMTMPAR